MMLDNKNEQKWPLTEKEVLKKNKQSRVISFGFLPAGQAKKKSSPQAAQHIYHTILENWSQHFMCWKCNFGVLHQRNETFLDIFPSCKDTDTVLFYRYKKESSLKRIFIRRRLSKLSSVYINCPTNKMNVPEEFKFRPVKVSSNLKEMRGNQWC